MHIQFLLIIVLYSVSESSPLTVGINQGFVTHTDYDKLCLSLLSCLPNEQELALNVCTILSNEGNYMLHLEQTPKLVDLLVAQTGVWSVGEYFILFNLLVVMNLFFRANKYCIFYGILASSIDSITNI